MFKEQGLSLFKVVSYDLGKAISLFCDRINNSTAETFIVLAQKSVCLFKILLEQNLLKSNICVKYISSNAIDFEEVGSISGKIALVDDIMITGYSIARIANKLIDAGVPEENLEIIALVKNKKYQALKFENFEKNNMFYCAISADDTTCIEFSTQICEMLSYYGIPYNSEFLEFSCLRENNFTVTEILNPNYWDFYDVTNLSSKGIIDVWTLFPKEIIKKCVWRYIGVDLNDVVHLKARLYMRKYPDNTCKIKFIPMAIIREIRRENLDKVIDLIINSSSLKIGAWSLSAKARFLQLYISYAMYKACYDLMDLKNFEHPTTEDLRIIFGHSNYSKILELLDQMYTKAIKCNLSQAEKCEADLLGYNKNFDLSSIVKLDDNYCYEINNALISAFLWWNDEKEISSRKKLSCMAPNYRKDYNKIVEMRSHLHKGFSYNAMQRIIDTKTEIFNNEQLISVFTDRAVDKGYIVPIFYENTSTDSIGWAYRHGEDLPFSRADFTRIILFLNYLNAFISANENNSVEYISEISLHKMIVVFYQIGLKEGGIFNRFLGFKNDCFLQERFCVHGSIAAIRQSGSMEEVVHPYVSQEEEGENGDSYTKFLFNLLKEKEFLKIVYNDKNNMMYIISADNIASYLYDDISLLKLKETHNFSIELLNQIKQIAKIISTWYIDSVRCNKRNEFKSDITMLASCSDIYKFLSSIATEVFYFKRYWNSNAKQLVSDISKNQLCEENEFKHSSAAQAFYSGIEKHRSYENRETIRIIGKVASILHKSDMHDEENKWNEWWHRSQMNGNDEIYLSSEKERLIYQLYFYATCYEWLVNGGLTMRNSVLINNLKPYEMYKEFYKDNIYEGFKIFEDLRKETDISKRAIIFEKWIEAELQVSDKLLENIELKLSNRAFAYTVRYQSALIFAVKNVEISKLERMQRLTWDSIQENSMKTKINIVKLDSWKEYKVFGIFYDDTNDEAFRSLLDLYVSFHNIACKEAYPTSAILIPHLPSNCVFEHNLRSNIKKHAKAFYDGFLSDIYNAIEEPQYIHNLNLIFTRFISTEQADKYKEKILRETSYRESSNNIKLSIETLKDVTYYIRFTSGSDISYNISPSICIMKNDTHLGTGFLFRFKGSPYCVTCRHLFSNDNMINNIYTVIDGVRLNLNPLNYHERERVLASDDILILKPLFDSNFTCDGSSFFSEKNCIISNNVKPKTMLSCKGYPNGNTYGKILNISYDGKVDNRYLQCSAETALEGGYSGSALTDDDGYLYGMHIMHKNDEEEKTGFFVSSEDIIAILKTVEEQEDIL